ncbi:MAG: type II secretion system protein GspM [Pseudomonadales bacterium]
MKALSQIRDRIDELRPRERAMILLGAIAAIFFLFDFAVIQPLDARRQAVENQIASNQSELTALATQAEEIVKQTETNPDQENREELRQYRNELEKLDTRLKETVQHLVKPADMPRLLRRLLSETGGLQLLQLNSLGSTPLVDERDSSPGEATAGAYGHGLRIKFSGDYFSTLNYLRDLEALEWNFFWDTIDYRVDGYPNATCTITVYTMSLSEYWIGP